MKVSKHIPGLRGLRIQCELTLKQSKQRKTVYNNWIGENTSYEICRGNLIKKI